MLMSVRGLLAASVVVGAGFTAMPAMAQDSDFTLSANTAIVSQYRFRGVDYSGGDIAIQGGVDVSHSSGIYVGAWGSSLDEDTVGYGHTELDVYAGWSGNVTDAVSLDVGALYYLYPNAPDVPGTKYKYIEMHAAGSFTLGPASATVGVAYAPKQNSLNDNDNIYFYTDLGVGIPNTPVSLSGHLGYTDGNFLTYTNDGTAFDWSVGASYALTSNVNVGVSYIGAQGDYAPGAYRFTRDAVVATLGASF